MGTDTLISIFAQENQYKVIKNNHIHKQRVREYCVRWVGSRGQCMPHAQQVLSRAFPSVVAAGLLPLSCWHFTLISGTLGVRISCS